MRHIPATFSGGMRAFVLLRDTVTGESQAHELVPHADADDSHGRISVASPVGRALAAAAPGSIVQIDSGAGARFVQVLSVDDGAAW